MEAQPNPAAASPADPFPALSQVLGHRRRLEVLNDIVRATARTLEPAQLFLLLYRELSRVVDTTGFLIGLYDEPSQMVEVVKQIESGVELPGGAFPLGGGLTSSVIRTRQPLLIRQRSSLDRPVQVQYATNQPGLPESVITVPLLFDGRVLGFLSIQSYRPEAYDEDDLSLLVTVAGHAASAIDGLHRAHRLNTRLQQRVSELETILASMADAVIIVDAAGCVVRLNRTARQLLCLDDRGVVLGQPLDEERWGLWPLASRAIAKALRPAMAALRRGETVDEVEVEVQSEGRRTLSFCCTPLFDASGALSGGVVVFRDITGKREADRLKDEILSIASHDLRSPVTTLRLQSQVLLRRISASPSVDETIWKGLTVIDRQTDRLVKLFNLLLDFSRLEAGRFKLRPGPVDLVPLAQTILAGVQETTNRHTLILEAPPRAEGHWDELRLGQVLQNLLTNAVKYSPDGGTIRVTVESDERSATVRVEDEGVGLSPDDLPHIFQQFFRAEGTRRLEGSGLGLYICYGIVTAHHGRIWAESAGLGRGSTFCVTLPRTSPGAE